MLEALAIILLAGYGYYRYKSPAAPTANVTQAPTTMNTPPLPQPDANGFTTPPPDNGSGFVQRPRIPLFNNAIMAGLHLNNVKAATQAAAAWNASQKAATQANDYTQQAIQALQDPKLDPGMAQWWRGVRDGVGDGNGTVEIARARANLAKFTAQGDYLSAFYYQGIIAWWLNGEPQNSTPFLVMQVKAHPASSWTDKALANPDFQNGMPGALALGWS